MTPTEAGSGPSGKQLTEAESALKEIGAHGFTPAIVTGKPVTQLEFARRGDITEEMEFIAVREGLPADELRPITFERDYTEMAAGSCLVSFGRTRVLCTASVEDGVPSFLRGQGQGWITA